MCDSSDPTNVTLSTMSCNREANGQHVYDGTIFTTEYEEEILETIYSGRVQLREDDVLIATCPKSGKAHEALTVRKENRE